RIDHKLPVGRPRDLDAAIDVVLPWRRHAPLRLAHLPRLWQEIERGAVAQRRGTLPARLQQLAAARLEALMNLLEEVHRGGAQHLLPASFIDAVQSDLVHAHSERKITARRLTPGSSSPR